MTDASTLLPAGLASEIEALGRSVLSIRAWAGHLRLELSDGTSAIAKVHRTGADGRFLSEASSLRWLSQARCIPVVDVLAVAMDGIAVHYVAPHPPSPLSAQRFGADLAQLHKCDAGRFGAAWAGFIGPLKMDNSNAQNWAQFYSENRVLPFLKRACDMGVLDRPGAAFIEKAMNCLEAIAGPEERACPIHGDLWSGNIVWGAGAQVWLIDPAAHGGHRETDLAMLDLFGLPYLDQVLDSYQSAFPLAAGWRDRQALHQLYPLLVHAVLFGPTYAQRAVEAAKQLL